MSALYDRLKKAPQGLRALSIARLKYEVLNVLWDALRRSELSQSDLAAKIGVRKSAVNQVFKGDGNVRIATLAEYLHVMGFEAELKLVRAGKPREDAVRQMREIRLARKGMVPAVSVKEKLDFEDIEWQRLPVVSDSRRKRVFVSRSEG